MNEAEAALKRWKLVYDELVQADRDMQAMPSQASAEAQALKVRIARLTRESDAALEELTNSVARLKERRKPDASAFAAELDRG